MPKTIDVSLDGATYKVPKFNMGQHERIVEIFKGDAAHASFKVLALALERADPKVDDPMALDVTLDDVKGAIAAILEFSGYRQEKPDPNAEAPGAPGTTG
jgi:hypothetical protein